MHAVDRVSERLRLYYKYEEAIVLFGCGAHESSFRRRSSTSLLPHTADGRYSRNALSAMQCDDSA